MTYGRSNRERYPLPTKEDEEHFYSVEKDRNFVIYEAWLGGASHRVIGAEFGMHPSRSHMIVQAVAERLRKRRKQAS